MVLNYFIGIVITLFGVWMLYRAFAPRLKSKEAVNWPTTQAEILEATVEEDRARSATGKANIAFVPFVRYQYFVEGKQYAGDKITVARAGYDFLDASNIRDQFKEGEKVPVHYNPANPGDSVLKPAASVGMFSRIPGIFVTLVGLILLAYTIIAG